MLTHEEHSRKGVCLRNAVQLIVTHIHAVRITICRITLVNAVHYTLVCKG